MFGRKKQKQEGGDNSTNVQAATVNNNYGISYKDAKEIALDVFHANFIHLKSEAAEIAKQRAEEITGKFFEQLHEKAPEAIRGFNDPGLQDTLFNVQKEYAKSGDEELGDLLVDILIDRSNTSNRNMLQLVLDESLKIAPRLTHDQINIITLNFLLTRVKHNNLLTLDLFKELIVGKILPFSENLSGESTIYNYIEYLRCGNVRVGNYGQLENMFLQHYKAMFQKGFSEAEFLEDVGDIKGYIEFIIPCFHDLNKYQLNTVDDAFLEVRMSERGLNEEQKTKLRNVFNKYSMSLEEVKAFLIGLGEGMGKIFDVWQNSEFDSLELTGVGIAIAHANYRRITGATINLSEWIQ